MKTLYWPLLMAAATVAGSNAATFRTDINPALQYYQAFQVAPDLSTTDRDYVFGEWRGQEPTPRLRELLQRYDNEFRLVRQAAHADVPCDWGIDMSLGPATLLPQLAPVRAVAFAARLRAMWNWRHGRPDEARDDLLAAYALGRNSSRDRTLVSALVQIATENIIYSTVAENYYLLSPENLTELVEGMDSAPARGTMAECVAAEKAFFHDWFIARIENLQRENPGNDSKVMSGIRELLASLEGPEEGPSERPRPNRWEQLSRASGGTSAGVLKLLRDMEPYYARLAEIFASPLPEYDAQAAQFSADIANSTNPLMDIGFPSFDKCRRKELASLVELAMLRAAAEYKKDGESGLQKVMDPLGQGPFASERFLFEGVDRGLVLTSIYAGRGFREKLILVEKEGPSFQVQGKDAGEPIPKNPESK